MANIYSKKTRKPVRFDTDEQLNLAIKSGDFTFRKGDMVYVSNPMGEKKYIPAEDAESALNQGYQLHGRTTELADDYARENQGIKGAAKVFFGQALDEAAMGVPELIYDKTKSPLEVAKKEALKKQFEAANMLGGLAGFGASMFYGGPIFKGAEKAGELTTRALTKTLAARAGEEVSKGAIKKMAQNITTKAAGTGVEGALLSAPYAITEAALGDPDDAAETMLYGVGLGGLFGGVSALGGSLKKLASENKLVQEAREKISAAIAERKDLKGIAKGKAVESLGPNLSQQEKLRAMEEVTDEFGNLVSVKPSKNLEKLGEDLLDEGIITPFGSKQDMYERLGERTKTLRKEVGETLQKFDDQFGQQAMVKADELTLNIRRAIDENELFNTAAFEKPRAAIEQRLLSLESKGELTLRQANLEKAAFQDVFKSAYTSPNAAIDVSTAQVGAVIPREINKFIRERMRMLDKDMAEELIRKQRLLGNLTQAENIAAKSAAREMRNNDFGINSYISAGPGAVIGGMAGGAPGAALGGLVGMMGREISRRFGDQILATALNKYGGMLFAEKAMKRAAEKLDDVPGLLERMAKAGQRMPSKKTTAMEALLRMFRYDKEKEPNYNDSRAVKHFKIKRIKEAREELIKWVQNPAYSSDMIANLTGPIGEQGAPRIQGALNQKMTKAITYLADAAPKPVAPESLFAPQAEYQPTDYEMNGFLQKVQVVEDPFTVFDELEAGTLTLQHMDALKNVYPGIHRYMVERITEEATKNPVAMDYPKRLNLSILMDAPVDPSLSGDRIVGYQNKYMENEGEQQQQGGVQMGGTPMQIRGDKGGAMMTTAQRLA